MSDCALMVFEWRDRYVIRWTFNDGDEEGATLGDETYTAAELAKASPDDRDHILATITASRTEDVARSSYDGYYWRTSKQAHAALSVIKAALKADPGAPWPEWALKATAAGWRAPKGWKP